MAWFIHWFNSRYYHLLYRHRDNNEASAFIDLLLQQLQPAKESVFLDLACGNGRHANHIAEKNYSIVGIDLSPENIIQAKKNQLPHAQFYVHDMRNYFRSNYFDFVLNLFTSFAYFDSTHDEKRAMKMAANALKPNGILVIDFFNAQKVINNLVPFEEKLIDGVHFKLNKKIEHGYIIKEIEITDNEKKFNFLEKVRLLTLQDFTDLLNESGLNLENTFGNYHLKPFELNNSERLIIIARKN
jgi:SAM-dependent methyltransferase